MCYSFCQTDFFGISNRTCYCFTSTPLVEAASPCSTICRDEETWCGGDNGYTSLFKINFKIPTNRTTILTTDAATKSALDTTTVTYTSGITHQSTDEKTKSDVDMLTPTDTPSVTDQPTDSATKPAFDTCPTSTPFAIVRVFIYIVLGAPALLLIPLTVWIAWCCIRRSRRNMSYDTLPPPPSDFGAFELQEGAYTRHNEAPSVSIIQGIDYQNVGAIAEPVSNPDRDLGGLGYYFSSLMTRRSNAHDYVELDSRHRGASNDNEHTSVYSISDPSNMYLNLNIAN